MFLNPLPQAQFYLRAFAHAILAPRMLLPQCLHRPLPPLHSGLYPTAPLKPTFPNTKPGLAPFRALSNARHHLVIYYQLPSPPTPHHEIKAGFILFTTIINLHAWNKGRHAAGAQNMVCGMRAQG